MDAVSRMTQKQIHALYSDSVSVQGVWLEVSKTLRLIKRRKQRKQYESGICNPGLMCIQMSTSSYCFSSPSQCSQCSPVIFPQTSLFSFSALRSILMSSWSYAFPSSPAPLTLPAILFLTSFIHHSLAHLALFPSLLDELTLELKDDGKEVAVRGVGYLSRKV